jgi:hypothetical protein
MLWDARDQPVSIFSVILPKVPPKHLVLAWSAYSDSRQRDRSGFVRADRRNSVKLLLAQVLRQQLWKFSALAAQS